MSDVAKVRYLRPDPTTGEVEELDKCPACSEFERDIRRKNAQITALRQDREEKARRSDLWPVAVELFRYWQIRTGHTRTEWNLGRFEEIEGFLRRNGEERCRLAIEGAAFEAFETKRKNGTTKRHDGWGLIFRPNDPDKFDEFVKRAPRPQHYDPKPDVLVEAQDGLADLLRDHAGRLAEAESPRDVALELQLIARSLREWSPAMRAAFAAREEEAEE